MEHIICYPLASRIYAGSVLLLQCMLDIANTIPAATGTATAVQELVESCDDEAHKVGWMEVHLKFAPSRVHRMDGHLYLPRPNKSVSDLKPRDSSLVLPVGEVH